jgi:hypothetical protein
MVHTVKEIQVDSIENNKNEIQELKKEPERGLPYAQSIFKILKEKQGSRKLKGLPVEDSKLSPTAELKNTLKQSERRLFFCTTKQLPAELSATLILMTLIRRHTSSIFVSGSRV